MSNDLTIKILRAVENCAMPATLVLDRLPVEPDRKGFTLEEVESELKALAAGHVIEAKPGRLNPEIMCYRWWNHTITKNGDCLY